MNSNKEQSPRLYGIAQFVLFITSYIPLFVIIILKQISQNIDLLCCENYKTYSFWFFLHKFGLSVFLIFISIFGVWGVKVLFSNLNKNINNGKRVTLKNIENRNSESIGYIATYIIPFVFQNFDSWFEIVAIILLMIIIYRIYINSNLLLINPLLSFKYSIFEVEYECQNEKIKNGLIIIQRKEIHEQFNVKIYQIGFKLFYAQTV